MSRLIIYFDLLKIYRKSYYWKITKGATQFIKELNTRIRNKELPLPLIAYCSLICWCPTGFSFRSLWIYCLWSDFWRSSNMQMIHSFIFTPSLQKYCSVEDSFCSSVKQTLIYICGCQVQLVIGRDIVRDCNDISYLFCIRSRPC